MKEPKLPTPDPSEISLYLEPADKLRLTIGDTRSYHTVVPAWAAPISHPKKLLSILDGAGKEILLVAELSDLDTESQAAVEEELRRRYLTATILKIKHAKVEFGATYWDVETERGHRDMVTQSLQENAQWLKPGHLLLIDVDGNRFEIPDVDALDKVSRQFVDRIL